jgi:release factor glutamine methyltransferase
MPAFSPALSVAAAQALMEARLAGAGIEAPRREARLLLAAAMGSSLADLLAHPERPIGAESGRIEHFLAERLTRKPLSRIRGWREFYGLEFRLNAATLDPRADTETLVDAVLALIAGDGQRHAPLRILDLGTGTGAILLALLSRLPEATGLGIDLAAEALDVARYNAESLGLAGRAAFRAGDLMNGLDEAFDILVSNPPYIPSGDLAGLDPEVALHDPRLALDGGLDGLDFYRRIVGQAPHCLVPGGILALEVGAGQAADVMRLLDTAGFGAPETRDDLAGIARVVVARRALREKLEI